MNKNNFLQAATTFRTEVLVLACFAERMKLISVVAKNKDDKSESKEVFPHAEAGEKLLSVCKDLFKKEEAHVNAMFKSDNRTKYNELDFSDHMDVMKAKVLTYNNQEKNVPLINSIVKKMKVSVRNLKPQTIHFDSGAKWTPSSHDEKRHVSMVKSVDDIGKILS